MLLLTLVVALGALVGCGGSGSSDGSASTAPRKAAATSESTTTAPEPEPTTTEEIAVCSNEGGDERIFKEGEVHLYDPDTGAELELRNQGFSTGDTWGPEGLTFEAVANDENAVELDNQEISTGTMPIAEGCAGFSYDEDLTKLAGVVEDREGRQAAGWFDSATDEVHNEQFLGQKEGFAEQPPRWTVAGVAFNPRDEEFWWVAASPGALEEEPVVVVVHGPRSETTYHLQPGMFKGMAGGADLEGVGVEGVYWRFVPGEGEPEVWLPFGNSDAIRLEPSGAARLQGPVADTEGILSGDLLPKSRYRVAYMRESAEGGFAAFIAKDEYEAPSLWVASPEGKDPRKLADIETGVRDYLDTPKFGIVRYGPIPGSVG